MKQLLLFVAIVASIDLCAKTRDDNNAPFGNLKEKYHAYKEYASKAKNALSPLLKNAMNDELFQFACLCSGTFIIAGLAEGCLLPALALSGSSYVPYIAKVLIKMGTKS